MTFDPNSNDAMFARIMERLDDLKADVQIGLKDKENRIRNLEQWRDGMKGSLATVSAIVSALAVGLFEVAKSLFTK